MQLHAMQLWVQPAWTEPLPFRCSFLPSTCTLPACLCLGQHICKQQADAPLLDGGCVTGTDMSKEAAASMPSLKLQPGISSRNA